MPQLTIERITGSDVQIYLPHLAKLRMEVFKEYPYLYDGDLSYELNYLKTYLDCPQKNLIIAKAGSVVVGASTAIPLIYETPECQKPFLENHFDISKIFYFGESVLLAQYRGQGVYKQFFKEREAIAREYGSTWVAFCTVVRPQDHHKRPVNYVAFDNIWRRYDYQKQPMLYAFYEWKEMGEKEPTTKPMVFWMKKL